MLTIMFLAFLLCYVNCWKKEIRDFRQEKQTKMLKEIRKQMNIDIQ